MPRFHVFAESGSAKTSRVDTFPMFSKCEHERFRFFKAVPC